MAKFNPFRPGSIVVPGMFAGRTEEVDALTRALMQTKLGNSTHFIVDGERGIGKTSLLYYTQCLATREVVGPAGEKFNFVTASFQLDQADDTAAILWRLGNELTQAASAHQRARAMLSGAWDFLKRWEVMGVKYNGTGDRDREIHALQDDFVKSVETISGATESELDGILFLIDEADKPHSGAQLGALIKSLTETFSRRKIDRVCFGLSGLPALLTRLRESHESSPRLFEEYRLDVLHPSERIWAIRRGLQAAREKSGVGTTISPEAEQAISTLSEGYPHFIQQFSYCAFEEDSDDHIDEDDVLRGAHRENGAFHQLGMKYFHDLYFDQIASDEYRKVLHVLAANDDGWVTKAQIREATGLKATTLTNAIHTLKKRNIIIPKEGVLGVYKLPSKAFSVWIRAFTETQWTGVAKAD